jgi:hypothetical protein
MEEEKQEFEILLPQNLTKSEVNALWEKVNSVEEIWDDRLKGRPALFVVGLAHSNPLYMLLDNFGAVALQGFTPGCDVGVHTIVWDKSHPLNIIKTFKRAIGFLFKNYGFTRITTMASENNPKAIELCKLMGFTEEGRMRKAMLYHDKWYDVFTYGLLREEFLGDKEV